MTPSFHSTPSGSTASFSIASMMWRIASGERSNTERNCACNDFYVNVFPRSPAVFGSSTCSPALCHIVTSCPSTFTSASPVSYSRNMINPAPGETWTGSEFKLCKRIPNCPSERSFGPALISLLNKQSRKIIEPVCYIL